MVFGLKSAGKSNWTQHTLTQDQYGAHLMYDVCKEHQTLNRYLPTHRRGDDAHAELDQVLSRMVLNVERARRPELVAVEEISRFCGPNSPPPEALYELVDLNRHYGVGLLGIARRPAQIHTDLIELADNLIIFRLTGKNDYRRLEQEVDGLGDAVRALGQYQFVHVEPDRSYTTYAAVPEMDTTGHL